MTSLVEQLAEKKQISNDFIDSEGKEVIISAENKSAVLEAMGYSVDDEKILAAQIEEEDRQYWLSVLDPVLVVQEKKDIVLKARLPKKHARDEIEYVLKLEDGTKVKGSVRAGEYDVIADKNIEKFG